MTQTDRPRLGAAVAVAAGFVAVVIATAFGWNGGLLDAVVTPPAIVRAFLVGLAVAIGVVLLMRSVARMGESGGISGGQPGQADVPGLIRAVRLAFLAVAALAAAAGWALGHPLPLIVAAVIAGIDVIETSFLLLVVGRR